MQKTRERLFSSEAKDGSSQNLHDHTRMTDALAHAMMELSFKEREETLFAIHGVSNKITETPELIEKSLLELEQCLVLADNSQILKEAKNQNASYVDNFKFRLKFLRAERFDPPKACKRLLKFLELKCALFGAHTLGRDLTLADLDPKSRECLDSGFQQTLPLRDTAGRNVYLTNTAYRRVTFTEIHKAQTWLYQMEVASSDEDVQKDGVIMVILNHGSSADADRVSLEADIECRTASIRQFCELLVVFPLRYECIHICSDRAEDRALVVYMLDESDQSRFRARYQYHEGTFDQYKTTLMTYGIPVSHFPIETDGTTSLIQHEEWLSWRKKVEKSNDDSHGKLSFYSYRPQDVLLGTSKTVKNHVGNFIYHELIHERLDDFNKSLSKTNVAQEIMDYVRSNHGRFIRATSVGGWEEVEDEVSIKRICNSFRDRRKVVRKRLTT